LIDENGIHHSDTGVMPPLSELPAAYLAVKRERDEM
jgi:hypothetical protein